MATIRENMSLYLDNTDDVPDHRPKRPRKKPARSDLEERQIDPRVMKAALLLAHGEPSRIEFHEDGSVTVHNHPHRR